MNSRLSIAFVGIAALVAIATAIYVVRGPIRSAAKIKPGDSAARVHELLGEPDAVYSTTAALRSSSLGPMSYRFADRNGRRGILLKELPEIVERAEWFEYLSAGHLVYFDERGVTEIFWGGT